MSIFKNNDRDNEVKTLSSSPRVDHKERLAKEQVAVEQLNSTIERLKTDHRKNLNDALKQQQEHFQVQNKDLIAKFEKRIRDEVDVAVNTEKQKWMEIYEKDKVELIKNKEQVFKKRAGEIIQEEHSRLISQLENSKKTAVQNKTNELIGSFERDKRNLIEQFTN